MLFVRFWFGELYFSIIEGIKNSIGVWIPVALAFTSGWTLPSHSINSSTDPPKYSFFASARKSILVVKTLSGVTPEISWTSYSFAEWKKEIIIMPWVNLQTLWFFWSSSIFNKVILNFRSHFHFIRQECPKIFHPSLHSHFYNKAETKIIFFTELLVYLFKYVNATIICLEATLNNSLIFHTYW